MIPHNQPWITQDDIRAVTRVMESRHIGQGRVVRELEEAMAARFGRYGWDACAVSSGTAALALVLGELPRYYIGIPSYACVSLAHAAVASGISSTIRDVCEPDFNLPDDPTAASVGVGMYGFPVDSYDIEDATHSIGASVDGKPCGSIGARAVLSFGATKPLPGGTGGMVLGPASSVANIRDRRDYDGKREFKRRFNWQMSDINAALVLSQLKRLTDRVDHSRSTAELYDSVNPFDRQRAVGNAEPSFYRYVLRVPHVRQQDIIKRFADEGVEAIVPIEPWELLHNLLGLENGLFSVFSVSENIARTTVSIPIWPGMSKDETQKVAEVLGGMG
jgi:perosamine synthetase